ncbi:MAG TPA: hypothetical protein VFH31_05370 [Pyrinomonadaceae bacterium]|nr:hypothetical protein [Pyrinomonadaceae bacterium]
MEENKIDGACSPSVSSAELERFEAWWKAHGQYCRAGGGEYEKTFAFRAWVAAEKAEREACAACVPSSWLDPLLTGPKRVIGDVSDIRPIEAVLGATKTRILARSNDQGKPTPD